MKKNLLIIILFICLYFINVEVYAEGKDVQAVFKQSYNVSLVTKIVNNETVSLEMGDLSIDLKTTDNNVKVVLIKASNDADEYAKLFTGNTNNYYLSFYNGDQKLKTSKVEIKIKNSNKVLNIYNNNGKLIEKSNEFIKLTGNDYFISITDFINIENGNYIFADINSLIDDLEDIQIDGSESIEIYNSKDIKIGNNEKIGTNYKAIISKNGEKSIYIIVIKGDINGDAKISLNDVTRLYHHYKKIELMEDVYILAGDVTTDSIINLNDITKIYHYYKEIIPSL